MSPAGVRTLQAAGGRPCGQWTPIDPTARGPSITDRIHARALRHPGRLAAFDARTHLSFETLERAANRVANTLLTARGPGSGAILLVLDAGTPAIVAALGVLRAGKHFVAVEPTFPMARLAEIAEDAGATLVLTDGAHEPLGRELGRGALPVVDLDALGTADDRPPGVAIAEDAIALLNYTSGSTGRPKGVVQTHRSAAAQALRFANAYRLGDADRLACFGSLAWAATSWDVFGPLCLGAAVGVYDVRRYGLEGLARWLEREGVTVVAGLAVMRRFARDCATAQLPRVRLVHLGGDTIYRRDVEACQRVFPGAILAVGLGTTEAGRAAELFLPPGVVPVDEVVPLGFPTPGVRLSLVAEGGGEVEPGEVGEIVVHSRENAAGYWKLPALTAERFRRDPEDGEGTAYFTGDLGRLRPDGALQHAGRKDLQVKIRGYRVPADEVEGLLLEVAGVREACVVAQALPDGAEQLVAFLVREEAGRLSVERLQARLRERLPDHMIPHRFVDLDALPTTPTGKPDRKALPVAAASRPALDAPYVAPRTPAEAAVAAIWADALGLEAVGVEDDFLALGGDSLRAMRIVQRVVDAFGVDLPVDTLLAGNTPASMTALLAAP